MEKAQIYITKDKTLVAKTDSGVEYFVNIFDGGGYYSAIWLQTQADMDRLAAMREAQKKSEAARRDTRTRDRGKKSLIQRLIGLEPKEDNGQP